MMISRAALALRPPHAILDDPLVKLAICGLRNANKNGVHLLRSIDLHFRTEKQTPEPTSPLRAEVRKTKSEKLRLHLTKRSRTAQPHRTLTSLRHGLTSLKRHQRAAEFDQFELALTLTLLYMTL